MPWFAVEDTLAFHRKTLTAGNAAMGLWVRAGSWSMQILTDGEIPAEVARTLGTVAEAKRLVAAGLWIPKADGYEFHEWADRQRSRVQVAADREAARVRQEKARQKAQGARESRRD
jgi:hypothetical protein